MGLRGGGEGKEKDRVSTISRYITSMQGEEVMIHIENC
jgi:hypothetical protein